MTELETIISQQKEIIDFFVSVKPTLEESSRSILEWQAKHQSEDDKRHKETNDNIKAVETKVDTFNKYYTSIGVVGAFVGIVISWAVKAIAGTKS